MLTRATGQPLTVALLGVLITMIAARSVNEPDPHQQRITMALLPVPAALSITAAALLAPHKVAADVGFVVVVFTAVYIRRFGARGRALGMVAFMSYFFTLYLRASLSELPWMIGAVVVGTLSTFVMSAYLLPDRPEGVLRATIRALRARMAIVVDTTAEAVRTGRLDERRRRRMRARTIRLNETASPTEQARELERNLQQFRVSAKPLLAGVAGLAARRSIRRELRLFPACDRYGRSLARSAEQYQDPVGSEPLARAFTSAAAQTRRNIDALLAIIDGAVGVDINSTTDELDAAETVARHQDGEGEPSADTRRFLTAVHALRQIERAVVAGATNLGARDGVKVPSPVAG